MQDKHPLLTTLLLALPILAALAVGWYLCGNTITNALLTALKLAVTK